MASPETNRYASRKSERDGALGYPGDPYRDENILAHQFAHVMHQMGLKSIDDTFDTRLQPIYTQAMEDGLWQGAYAAEDYHEYWAEGVQSYFDTNRE